MEARDLRVSDAEREHVGELLQRAVGQGMLSLGEFTERMDTALASKTRGELNSVLADLPGMQIAEEHRPAPKPFAAPTPQPAPRRVVQEHWGHGSGASDTLRGTMSTVTRKGPWNVPANLRVATRMSTVTLDFTQAVMSTQVVEIHVDDYCSTVTLIVPTEATVDLNGVDTVAGSATNKVRTGPPYGPLHLVVSGKVRLGSVTAKHPFGSSIRRMFG
ncbi:DUF1707 domain-containing protein [Rhodococcus sp. IEGM 1330]|uniref:DUF1707 SHOCT-like domain-containing protein n=1 Tax=Rhodococcus sp. IEGM 1330 TaxID=3082225 RepID=UPI002953A1FA|nr:DUF1707 domain-containing protein [Rhodococcus sp. IEGM 1330]MDV8024715.1 DUF1707 domain-containing protein [Rhodococcus sp. IEGM 1330]